MLCYLAFVMCAVHVVLQMHSYWRVLVCQSVTTKVLTWIWEDPWETSELDPQVVLPAGFHTAQLASTHG